MNTLDEAIERLSALEPGLRSLDSLFALGEMVPRAGGGFQVGDFDLHIWEHTLDGFSVGAITRCRQAGQIFPKLIQSQKKWILCSKGTIRVMREDKPITLGQGARITIPPRTAHEIHPVSEDCAAVIVTIPSDPGMR